LDRTHALPPQGEMEGPSSARHGDCMLPTEVLGEGFLERLHPWTVSEHAGRQNLPHRREFLFAENRSGDGDHRRGKGARSKKVRRRLRVPESTLSRGSSIFLATQMGSCGSREFERRVRSPTSDLES